MMHCSSDWRVNWICSEKHYCLLASGENNCVAEEQIIKTLTFEDKNGQGCRLQKLFVDPIVDHKAVMKRLHCKTSTDN